MYTECDRNENWSRAQIALKLCFVAVMFIASGAVAHGATWIMPTPYSDSTFHTVNIRAFADEVKRITGGELVIEVHSGGELIKHADIANAVQSGDVPWPPQGLYSKVEITDPNEFEGKAFRAYNSTLEQLALALGSVPTRLEVSEIPGAFERGEIDAMMTSATTGATTKSWEFLGFFYDLQAWLPKNIVFANREALNALPQAQQDAVFTAAKNARANGWLLSQIDAVEAVKILFENGMTVLTPGQVLDDSVDGGAMREVSPVLLEGLSAVSEAIKEDWLEKAGTEGEQLLRAFEEISQ